MQTHAQTYAEILTEAAQRLRPATDTPRLDAEILLAHAIGISRARLLASLNENTIAPPEFETYLVRRAAAEPIAYITRVSEFFSLEFEIDKPVLVPRPETEHLVETVLHHVGARKARILEIGVGSGCVSVSLAYRAPNSFVLGTDIREPNIKLARLNSLRHEVEHRVAFRHGDLFDALESTDEPFDVICSNPPYIEEGAWDDLPATIRNYENPQALLAGPDGLSVIRELVAGAKDYLNRDGLLAFEMGMGQWESVRELLREHGYRDVNCVYDLAGIERIAVANAPR